MKALRGKKVCIIVLNDVERDPRVNRQVRWLAETGAYNITVVGFGSAGVEVYGADRTVTFQQEGRTLAGKMASAPGLILCNFSAALAGKLYWSSPPVREMYAAVIDDDYDLIHANDWDTLPMAVRAARKMKKAAVIYDAHEFATLEFEESWKFKLFYRKYRQFLESQYIKSAAGVITVSGVIAEKLAQTYGVKPAVIMNCPDYVEKSARNTDPADIRLCHHGGYNPARGIEELVRCMKFLDERYSLHLRLICDQDVLSRLKKLAMENAPDRIYFHQPVKPSEIVDTIYHYDIGVYALKPENFNNAAALPNKFFEFIMAGLCLCIGPTPEMKRIVTEFGCGTVAEGFDAESLAQSIRLLSQKDIMEYKKKALQAARVLNARVEGEKMIRFYRELLN